MTNRPGAVYRRYAERCRDSTLNSFLCRIISAVDCHSSIKSRRLAAFNFDFEAHNRRCFVSPELAGPSTYSCESVTRTPPGRAAVCEYESSTCEGR